jgi:hypothetical protein
MLKTAAQIAAIKGVTRQAALSFINREGIPPSGRAGKFSTYDVSIDPLASYISGGDTMPKKKVPKKQKASTPKVSSREDSGLKPTPINDLFAGKNISSALFADALKIARENQDGALLSKLSQQAAKEAAEAAEHGQRLMTERAKEQIAQERAERERLCNEIRRNQYVRNEEVRKFFAQYHAVDTSVFMSLGQKLSGAIDALPPGKDRKVKITSMINKEVEIGLKNKQRIMIDFVNGVVV